MPALLDKDPAIREQAAADIMDRVSEIKLQRCAFQCKHIQTPIGKSIRRILVMVLFSLGQSVRLIIDNDEREIQNCEVIGFGDLEVQIRGVHGSFVGISSCGFRRLV